MKRAASIIAAVLATMVLSWDAGAGYGKLSDGRAWVSRDTRCTLSDFPITGSF